MTADEQLAVESHQDVDAFFWAECEQGKFWLQSCRDCGGWQYYPRYICSHCWSEDIVWARPSGRGTVRSFSVVQRGSGAFASLAPYTVALVEFDEGPTMMTNLLGAGQPEVGMVVRLVFDDRTGRNLPVFEMGTDHG